MTAPTEDGIVALQRRDVGIAMKRWMLMAVCLASPVSAQAPVGPSQAALNEVVRRGTMAALAPLCGLREEAWAFDLRRAAILEATGTTRLDDPALHDAVGGPLVISALSYAETEALESFAEASPGSTCGPLRSSPELAQADAVVGAFRNLKSVIKPAS